MFMWDLGCLIVPLGIPKLMTIISSFFITKFCIRAIGWMVGHHKLLYSNQTLKNPLPHMKAYIEVEFKKVKDLIEEHREEYDKPMTRFRREDTTIFQGAIENHT